jgi:pimeloyl-ACP methyl ester carboxylesterase
VNSSTQIIATALGDVQIDDHGLGIPVLVVHGSPGGVDGAQMMGRFLPPDRFRTIAVSRPGYLGTPLDASMTSIDHEADLLAAVLDNLGIVRASVLAWSGGGPSSYRLAVRHPERVAALIEIAAVSSRYQSPGYPRSEAFLFGSTLGNWTIRFLARYAPNQLVEGALAGEGSLSREEVKTLTKSVMADPEQREAVLEVAKTMSWSGPRRAGWNNDLANFGAIDSLELERVGCPVLLIQGDVDTDVVPEYSYAAHTMLLDSTLVVMERGTHLAFYAHPDAANVQEKVRKWLIEHR